MIYCRMLECRYFQTIIATATGSNTNIYRVQLLTVLNFYFDIRIYVCAYLYIYINIQYNYY